MDKYQHLQLLPTETVIQTNEEYYVKHNGESVDLFLTNQNIICTTGKPGKRKYKIYKYPLDEIKTVNGNLQIRLENNFGQCNMQIFFDKGVGCFTFLDSNYAKAFLKSIRQVILGDIYSIQTSEERYRPEGLLNRAVYGVTNSAASIIKSGFSGLKMGLGIKSKKKKDIDLYVGEKENKNFSNIKYQEELNDKRLREEREYKLQMARIKNSNQYSSRDFEQSNYKFCVYCGARINEDALFCSECGRKV